VVETCSWLSDYFIKLCCDDCEFAFCLYLQHYGCIKLRMGIHFWHVFVWVFLKNTLCSDHFSTLEEMQLNVLRTAGGVLDEHSKIFFNFLLCLWHSEVQHIEQTLGAFAKLRKAAISFVVSVPVYVRLYVHRQQLSSNWTDFHEIWYFRIFRISAEKFRVCLTSVKNNRCFTRRPVYFYGNILIIKPMSCTNFSNLFLD